MEVRVAGMFWRWPSVCADLPGPLLHSGQERRGAGGGLPAAWHAHVSRTQLLACVAVETEARTAHPGFHATGRADPHSVTLLCHDPGG